MPNIYVPNIEKNVPKYNKWTELVSKMEVGDSVLFPNYSKTRAFKAALNAKGHKHYGQSVSDGFRIWRES